MTVTLMRKLLACIYYGDLLVGLPGPDRSPTRLHKGDAAALQEKWLDTICGWVLRRTRAGPAGRSRPAMPRIAADFAAIPVRRVPKVKVGVVGEIYVKYSPLGNNDLEKFLASQDWRGEPAGPHGLRAVLRLQPLRDRPALWRHLPGKARLRPGSSGTSRAWSPVMIQVLKDNGFHAPLPFRELVKLADGFHLHRRQDGGGLAPHRRDDRAGPGRV